jgi:hypothetical protein
MASTVTTEMKLEGDTEAVRRWNEWIDELIASNKELEELERRTREAADADAEWQRSLEETEGRIHDAREAVNDWIESIAAMVAAYVTLRKAKEVVVESVEEALDSDDAWKTLSATLEVTGRRVDETTESIAQLAKETAELTRFQDGHVVKAASLISIYGRLSDESMPRVLKLSEDMARLFGRDLASQATILGRALESPTTATRTLRQAGVTLTEAVEQQIKKMVEAGDVAQAQEVILTELEAKFAGLADTLGDDLTDRLERLQNRTLQVEGAFGETLLPTLDRVIEVGELAGEVALKVAQSLDDADTTGLEDLFTRLEESIIDLGDQLIENRDAWQEWIDGGVLAINTVDELDRRFGGLVRTVNGLFTNLSDVTEGFGTIFSEDLFKALELLPEASRQHLAGEDTKEIEKQFEEHIRRAFNGAPKEEDPKRKTLREQLEEDRKADAEAKKRRDEERTQAKKDAEEQREALKKKQEAEEAAAASKKRFDEAFKRSAEATDRAFEAKMRERERADATAKREAARAEEAERKRIERALDDARKAEEKAAEKKAKEEAKGFQASILGLTDLHRRISAGAASTPEKDIEKAVVKAGVDVVGELKGVGGVLRDIDAGMRRAEERDKKRKEGTLA